MMRRSQRRARARGRGPILVAAVAVLLAAGFLPGHSTGSPAPIVAIGEWTAPPASTSTIAGYVCEASANVPGPGPSGCGAFVPVANATVYLQSWGTFPSSTPVDWPRLPGTISDAANNQSASNGRFSITYSGATGAYVLWTPNSSRFGGGFATVQLSGGSTAANLVVYPYAAEGNATFVLPAWNSLSAYASNANCWGCDFDTNGVGSQVPLTSWTQDGVFYVNATDRLVFYSFANRSVTNVAAWTPLHSDVMYYPGIENTEWITADGSWVYEFGCTAACTSSSSIEFYAANVSTGRTVSWTFTGITDSVLSQNGQINMIGTGGNDSIAALIAANGDAGVVYGWNVWNHTQWKLASLPYFEANNIQWVSEVDSYINVEAQGSAGDQISQWQLRGPGAGGSLVQVASLSYWTGSTSVNGENWGSYNLTSHEFSLSSSDSYSTYVTAVFGTAWSSSDGIYMMDRVVRQYTSGSSPTPAEFVYTSEHRSSADASGYVADGNEGTATFYNQTMYDDPFNGMYLNTNVTLGRLTWYSASTGGGHWAGVSSSNFPEGLFYNASYQIADSAIDCRAEEVCPLNGQGSYADGTIYWVYPALGPEFPFPTTSALAQPDPPGAPSAVSCSSTSDSVTLSWAPPATGQNPILNYTLRWGSAPSLGTSVNLLPTNRSYTVGGLSPGDTIYFALEASNLHSTGAAAYASGSARALGYAAAFAESGLPRGATWWVNSTTGAWADASSTVGSGGSGTTIAIDGLVNATYGFAVGWTGVDWTAAPASGSFTIAGAPVGVPAIAFAPRTFTATFVESGLPSGSVWWVNSTVSAWTARSATVGGRPGSPIDVAGLTDGTYAFEVGMDGARWAATPGAGSIAIEGANVTAPTIDFHAIDFSAAFSESGLPSSTTWWVNSSDGVWAPCSATVGVAGGTAIEVDGLVNGTYALSVSEDDPQYFSASSPSSVSINGSGTSVAPVVYTERLYTVTINETGLPTGVRWWVNSTSGAWAPASASAGGAPIVLADLRNGSYGFTAEAAGAAWALPSPEQDFTLATSSLVLPALGFVRVGFALTFEETGLSNGTAWSVTLDGEARSSDSAAIVFTVENGSYLFTVHAVGGASPTPAAGAVHVSGAPITEAIQFVSSSASPANASAEWIPAIGASVAFAAAAGGLVVLLRRRAGGAGAAGGGRALRPPDPPS